MKLQFLGTAAAVPSIRRNVSALALRLEQRRDWWLFDCGEGTQQQLLRTDLSFSQVRRIFLSHLHGDHCYGLPGLMATRGFKSGTEPLELDVYGPPGTREFIDSVRRVTRTHYPYRYAVQEIAKSGIIMEDDEYLVHAVEVPHVGPTLAYVVVEKTRAGRFRVEEAQALGIRPGPIYSKLKQGETVKLDDGREIDGSTLVEPPRKGRKIVLVFDTSDASAILDLARGADLMVHEATYLERTIDPQIKDEYGHSTAAAAGRMAKKADVKRLVLNHFSLRYTQTEPGMPTVRDLVAEADGEFKAGAVVAAEDFMSIEVPMQA